MRIKIRVYNPYDLDIIALSEAPNFSVPNAMKQTLKYYAAGKRFLVEIPALTEQLKNENYVKGFYVELDDVKDADAINLVKSVPEGWRNAFVKSIFRASFEVSPISLFLGEGGAAYVDAMIRNPRYGKYPVQREIIDPIVLAENEVGAMVSDAQPDVKQLIKATEAPTKAKKPVKPTSSADKLRELTQSAYGHADQKKKDKEARQQEFLNKGAATPKMQPKPTPATSEDLDDLLDSMM